PRHPGSRRGSGRSWPPRGSSSARGAASIPWRPNSDAPLLAIPNPEARPESSADDPVVVRAAKFRATLSAVTLVMVGLSWPLWIDLADFPAVLFVRWFPDYPRAWSWLGLGAVVIGLGLGMTRQFGRAGVGLAAVVMVWLVQGDQLRFQPWVYQFLVLGTLLV